MTSILSKTKAILKDLVSFAEFGGQSNHNIAQYIEDYLDAHEVEWHNCPGLGLPKRSILARIGPPKDGGVILSGHMDVVPVSGQNWTFSPFELKEKDDKLYGRGSCDMKGFLACVLALVPELVGRELTAPVYIAFSYDEEIGCQGSQEIVDFFKSTFAETPKYAIIGEPTMMHPATAHKGIAVFETRVSGPTGHSSRISATPSSINVAAKLICKLEQIMIDHSANFRDDRFDPPFSTLHCGVIEASGVASNVIAPECVFHWDVRVIPSVKVASVLKDFTAYAQVLEEEFSSITIDTSVLFPEAFALDTSEDGPGVTEVKQMVHAQQTEVVSFGTEAGFFSRAGIESIVLGPGNIAQAHQPNEYVEVSQLKECLDWMNRLADSLSAH